MLSSDARHTESCRDAQGMLGYCFYRLLFLVGGASIFFRRRRCYSR